MNRTVVSVLLAALALPVTAQPPGPRGPAGGTRDAVKMFLQHADQDRDGKVSEAEFLKPSQEQFRRMDTNGDGYLTPDEIRQFDARMRQRMQQMRQQRRQQGAPAPAPAPANP